MVECLGCLIDWSLTDRFGGIFDHNGGAVGTAANKMSDLTDRLCLLSPVEPRANTCY